MDDMGWTYKAQYEQAVTELEQVRYALTQSKKQTSHWFGVAQTYGETLRIIRRQVEDTVN